MMDVHLPLLRGLGIITRVCELPRRKSDARPRHTDSGGEQ
jgi:hypothetical protein